MAKRKILKDFTISEISAVDLPAQAGARAVLMKRGADLGKRQSLLSSVNGHSHILAEEDFDGRMLDAGETSFAVAEGAEMGHAHPWIRREDGTILIGEADGHTHDIEGTTKRADTAGGRTMPKTPEEIAKELEAKDAELAKAKEEKDAEIAKLQAERDEAQAIAKMSDKERKAFDEMDDEDAKKKFLKASPEERQKVLAKQAEADPVVYTGADGTEYRKSDGRLADLAKRADEQEERLAKAQAEAEDATIQKRVSEEFAGFPKPKAVAAILKAVGGIEDEALRKEAEEVLKGAHSAMTRFTETAGHRGGESDPAVAKASGDFMAKVNEIRKRDDCGRQAAMEKARTEHPELFKAFRGEADG